MVMFLSKHKDVLNNVDCRKRLMSTICTHWMIIMSDVHQVGKSPEPYHYDIMRLAILLGGEIASDPNKFNNILNADYTEIIKFYNDAMNPKHTSLLTLLWVEMMYDGRCSIRFEVNQIIYC